MVPKPAQFVNAGIGCFRAVLFRMVPKQDVLAFRDDLSFRAVLFRMVPKQMLC